jgi:hypothetical protein
VNILVFRAARLSSLKFNFQWQQMRWQQTLRAPLLTEMRQLPLFLNGQCQNQKRQNLSTQSRKIDNDPSSVVK